MTPVFVLTDMLRIPRSGGFHWWIGELHLDGKCIAELTMPGYALTSGDALADAKRIAEINRWEFRHGTKEAS